MAVIGITPLFDNNFHNIWMLPDYIRAVREAGGAPMLLTPEASEDELEEIVTFCDGFLFTGGQDISPSVYGQEASALCGETSPERDGLETRLLSRLLTRDKPVLGICRGVQLLNVCLGGDLYQDLPSERPGCPVHKQKKPYDRPCHDVRIRPDSLLCRCLEGRTELRVNSLHHQAVRRTPPNVLPCAFSPDGLIEGIELPGKRFFLAVQWHPEHLPKNDPSRALFRCLVTAAGHSGT